MPRVHYVKKARKDNPAVNKGEPYYWWKFRYGGKRFSKTPPKASQLTQSEFLSQLYDLQEQREDACSGFRENKNLDDFKSNIEDIASQLEDLGSECEDRRSNMPDQLQDSDTGQLLEDRYTRCQEMADELNSATSVDDLEDLDADVTLMCLHCNDEKQFQVDFRGTHKCVECGKEWNVTDEMIEDILEEREKDREDAIENIIGEVEGVDLDCE